MDGRTVLRNQSWFHAHGQPLLKGKLTCKPVAPNAHMDLPEVQLFFFRSVDSQQYMFPLEYKYIYIFINTIIIIIRLFFVRSTQCFDPFFFYGSRFQGLFPNIEIYRKHAFNGLKYQWAHHQPPWFTFFVHKMVGNAGSTRQQKVPKNCQPL